MICYEIQCQHKSYVSCARNRTNRNATHVTGCKTIRNTTARHLQYSITHTHTQLNSKLMKHSNTPFAYPHCLLCCALETFCQRHTKSLTHTFVLAVHWILIQHNGHIPFCSRNKHAWASHLHRSKSHP